MNCAMQLTQFIGQDVRRDAMIDIFIRKCSDAVGDWQSDDIIQGYGRYDTDHVALVGAEKEKLLAELCREGFIPTEQPGQTSEEVRKVVTEAIKDRVNIHKRIKRQVRGRKGQYNRSLLIDPFTRRSITSYRKINRRTRQGLFRSRSKTWGPTLSDNL